VWLPHSDNLVVAHDGARAVDNERDTHRVLKLLQYGVIGTAQT
jgi:hypothetical protein